MDVLRAADEHERAVTGLRAAEERAARTRAGLGPLAGRARTLDAALADAEETRDRLRDAHAGAELARRLVVGQDCPTCLRPVERLPHHPASADLRAAERHVKACRKEAEQARARLTEAESETRHLERTAHELVEHATRTAHELTGRAAGLARDPADRAARAGGDPADRGARAGGDPADRGARTAGDPDAEAAFAGSGPHGGDDLLAGVDRDDLEGRLAAVRAAERRAAKLRQAARDARARLATAQRRAEELTGRTDRLWRDLEAARDTVVPLGAPPLDRDDLHHAWTALLAWRADAGVRERAALEKQDARVAEAERRARTLWSAVAARLAEHGVETSGPAAAPAAPEKEPPGRAAPGRAAPGRTAPGAAVPGPAAGRFGELVAAAIAEAQAHLARVQENRATARELDERARAEEGRARVAKELAQCLRADAFERWLCTEALDLLVTAASDTLRELSDGQYELALGARNEIEVIDHAEAGMRRNARTLSGGETFQAALALALALSDQVAGLSATAARSLDSLFLDEGFGSLDPATLDTVAATLERLAGGRERMVGVVTHVPALADRIPVRFEVRRDAKGSHLHRVTA
ncbi:SbcC/MukB-like Walker B domain-containing protein [Nonomuraea thailandensis]